jgi:hypothetical protein
VEVGHNALEACNRLRKLCGQGHLLAALHVTGLPCCLELRSELRCHLSTHLGCHLSTHLGCHSSTHLRCHLSTHLRCHLSTHLGCHLSMQLRMQPGSQLRLQFVADGLSKRLS